ncbi:MAG: ribosome small subunit-dependent GTPase A [Phenylobacterium zucineum]|nr:MAG: ribosome small subunit-dependent GTPase A [Phenylobacterium zucineum]
MTVLESYGWTPERQTGFEPFAERGLLPGRIVVQQRSHARVMTEDGEVTASLAGKLAYQAGDLDFPVTGDWVACTHHPGDGASIQSVLPRTGLFVRRAAGQGQAVQAVAANVDLALLVSSLNADLNPRRLERYLAMALESRVRPVVVLTKADLAEQGAPTAVDMSSALGGVEVLVISARTGLGMDALSARLAPGLTAVLLGSSGAGKSTIVNALAGEEKMTTAAIRDSDAHGRHTTTHRELVLMPSGALLLDTPGMRELGLWDAQAGLTAAFADLEAQLETLAQNCRFRDCRHGAEPGCAVQAALREGQLDRDRWQSLGKLRAELAQGQGRQRRPPPVKARRSTSGRSGRTGSNGVERG